jgi:threonine dehydratase
MNLDFKNIINIHKKITDNVKWTETSFSNSISEKIGTDIFFKFENRQYTGAFKVRGSYSKLLSLSDDEKQSGVVAMSAGNHAQGLAFIAKKMNINSNIVMPEGTPFTKIRRTKNFGGNVIIHGSSLGESYEYVQKLINERGYTEVHPYNDLNVIAGQGTISYEMLSDCNDIDILLVPVGGGGLIAGCSLAAKAMNQNIKVIGIESELYPSLTNIMFNKKIKCKGSTLAEGIAVSEIGQIPMSFIKNFVDDVITVSDKSIERAIAMLAEHEKVVVEGAGATGLAALIQNSQKFKGKKVGVILCGGNIDSKVLSSILMRDLVRSGQVTTLTITMTEKTWQLQIISKICADEGANVLEVEHSRFAMDLSASVAKLNITIETQNSEHLKKIIQEIERNDLPVEIEGLV